MGEHSQLRPKQHHGTAKDFARDQGDDLGRLKQMSKRLRDPSAQGEVLTLVLEFAAQSFERVAIFMLREDEAIGLIQSGLAAAGGPDDREFQQLAVPAREPAWFRAALESREGVKAPPTNEADRLLALALGSHAPAEAYVAPIESSREVVALVYVDNLSGGAPISATACLDIVLHEAGLALERALLERALADAAP
jgi:K+-sensing histidine kinase KdpD